MAQSQQDDSSKITMGQPQYGTFSPLYHPHLHHHHQHHHHQPQFPQSQISSISSPLYPIRQSQLYQPIPVGYQAYGAVVDGIPVSQACIQERRLPCCGLGIGWALTKRLCGSPAHLKKKRFLAGFFFAAIPWYVGAFILLFVGVDYREKAGLLACTIGAILVAITIIFGVSKENLEW